MQATGQVFRSFAHSGAHYAGQLSLGTHAGHVHPHAHALVWQRAEDEVDWLAEWRDAVGCIDAGVIAHSANVQPAQSVEAVARYVSRGAIDLAEWDERPEDLVQVVNSLHGLKMFGSVLS